MDENILLIRNPIDELELTPEKVKAFMKSNDIVKTEKVTEEVTEETTEQTPSEQVTTISKNIYELLGQPEYIGAVAFFNNKEKALVFIAEEAEGEEAESEETIDTPVLTPAFQIDITTDYDKALADLDKILFKTNGKYETYINPHFSKTDFDSPIQGICVVDYENNMTNSYFVTENNTYTLGYYRPVAINKNDTELTAYLDEEKTNAINIGLEATKILKLPLPSTGKEYYVYIQDNTLYITDEGDPRPEDYTGLFWISIPITQGLDNGEKADIFNLNKDYDITNLGLILK